MRIHFKSTSYGTLAGISMVSFLCALYITVWNWNDLKELHKSILTSRKVSKFSIGELMGSSNVWEVVRPNVTTVISQPSMPFLKGRNENQRPFAVILVTSMAKSFNQRHAIRSTWYKWADELNVRVFFMIGFHDSARLKLFQILQDEQAIHNDLIIDEFEEGYYKLPGKVLRMLKWYNATYTQENAPRFFVKADQDVFIHLPNFVTALRNTSYYKHLVSMSGQDQNATALLSDAVELSLDQSDPETYYVGGKRFETPKVDSNPDSKWYIDSAEREKMSWPANLYPTYTNGPCYVMSGNIVSSIYETSFTVPIYPFEDVYVVGMIAYDRLHLHISNINEMWLDKSSISKMKSKSKMQKMVAIHPVDHPLFMTKICKKIPSCRLNLALSGTAKLSSYYYVYLLALGLTIVKLI